MADADFVSSPGKSPRPGQSPNMRERLEGAMRAASVVGNELDAMFDAALSPVPESRPLEAQNLKAADAPVAEQTKTPVAISATANGPVATAVQPAWVVACNKWLAQHPLTLKQILLRDKITYCVGLFNLMLSSLLFAHPLAFIASFQIKAVVLLSTRWAYYRLKDWHYYMYEFCYVCILLGIVHTAWMPTNPVTYQLTFALFTGVLTPAVIATRNAFVLHSVDKMTSLFQHLTPALVAWLLRWNPAGAVRGWAELGPEQQEAMGRAGFVRLTLLPMGVWLTWALIYYVLVFTLADHKVRQRGYATMFSLQTKNPKSGVSKFILGFKTRQLQYAAYLGVHGACCLVGCLTNTLWWHSRAAHTLLVAGVLFTSMWNGAGYQMHVFSKKYMESIEAEAAAHIIKKD